MVGLPVVAVTPSSAIKRFCAVFTASVAVLLHILITVPLLFRTVHPVGNPVCVADISRLGGTVICTFILPEATGVLCPAVPVVAFTVACNVPIPPVGTTPELSTSIFSETFWEVAAESINNKATASNNFFIVCSLKMFMFLLCYSTG
jgi:hypothetical protein